MRLKYSYRRTSIVSFPDNSHGKTTKKYYIYVNEDTGEVHESKPEIMTDINMIDITKDVLNDRLAKAREKISEEGYNETIGKSAKTKITKSVSLWLSAMELQEDRAKALKKKVIHYPTFVTLTLSSKQDAEDVEIKRDFLNHFLIKAKRKWNISNYVWRAEPQKNGNIHIHILFDRFVKWQEIRNVWNEIQDKKGYVQQFVKVHKKENPNSTDVHRLQKINNPAAYICKYMTKADELEKGEKRRKILGRVWGMSDKLRSLEYFEGGNDKNIECNQFALKNEIEFIKKNWFNEMYWSNVRQIKPFVKVVSFNDKIQYIAADFGLKEFGKLYINHLDNIYKELYMNNEN